MKDAFLTIRYKSGWIHSCHNRETEQEEFKVQFADHSTRPAKSFHGAKRILTRAEKGAGIDPSDIGYVQSVLSGAIASCVPDGELEPPTGAKCRTRSGFRAWLRRVKAQKGAGK